MRNKQNIILLLVLLAFLFNTRIFAQNEIQKTGSVYKINRKVELPLTLGLFGASLIGFEYLRNKPTLSLEEVSGYQQNDIWWFDRSAVKQDVSFRNRAHDISDFFLNSSVLLPTLLALDKNIRKDWVDLLILYGESHAINTDIYLLNTSFMLRSRPFTYNPDIPMNDKLATETRNSFFSGHVSTTATATFFAAKVYSDYHPEIGNKKYWLYVAAVIPPSLVGYYRFKALKHFPTDILTGFAIGSVAGILIPQMHKIKEDSSGFAFVPFAGNYNGLQISYTFK